MRRAIQGMLEELEVCKLFRQNSSHDNATCAQADFALLASLPQPNLWEFNLRRIVDYGHTFSPCLEMAALESDAPLLHGEAVCIDMCFTHYGRQTPRAAYRGRGLANCPLNPESRPRDKPQRAHTQDLREELDGYCSWQGWCAKDSADEWDRGGRFC